MDSFIKLLMSAFKRITTAITSPFRMIIVKIQRMLNINVITAKLISPLSKTIKSLFSLKPQSKKDYTQVFGLWVYKKVFLLIIVCICAGVFLYFSMFAPKISKLPAATMAVKTVINYDYNDIKIADFSGIANVKAANGKVVYTGEILKGVCVGTGELYDIDGKLIYKGQFDQNQYNGKGIGYYKSGNIKYEGEYQNNKYSGKGKLYGENGLLLYEGEFANGLYEGKGKLFYDSGLTRYEGAFSQGKFNGTGTSYFVDGVVGYIGEFFDGKAQGTGELYNSMGKAIYNGVMYDGNIGYRSLINASLADVEKMFPETPRIYYTADYSCFVFEEAGVIITADCVVRVNEWIKPGVDIGNEGLYFPPDGTVPEVNTQSALVGFKLPKVNVSLLSLKKPANKFTQSINIKNTPQSISPALMETIDLTDIPDNTDDTSSDNKKDETTSSDGEKAPPEENIASPDFIDRKLSLYFQIDKDVWQSEEELDKTKVFVKKVAVFNNYEPLASQDAVAIEDNSAPTLEECVAIDYLRKATPTAFGDIIFEIDRQNKLFVKVWNISFAGKIDREVYESDKFIYRYCYLSDNTKDKKLMYYMLEGR